MPADPNDDLRHQCDAYEDALTDLAHIARGKMADPWPADEPKPDDVGGRAYAAVCELVRERDAYRKAKAENDERFMLERDDARRERDLWRQRHDDLAKALDAIAAEVRGAGVELRDDDSRTALGLVVVMVRERDALLAQLAEARAALQNERGDGAGPTPDWSYTNDEYGDHEWCLWHVPSGRPMSDGQPYSVAPVWDEDTSRPFWMMFSGGVKLQIGPDGSSMVKHAREGMWLITRHLQENP